MITDVVLPCRCTITVDFPKGERGVSCPTHERSFVIAVDRPRELTHVVAEEIPYVRRSE